MGVKRKHRKSSFTPDPPGASDPLAGTAAALEPLANKTGDDSDALAAQCQFDDDVGETDDSEPDAREDAPAASHKADASEIKLSEWPFKELDGSIANRQRKFQVIVHGAVMDEIHKHGKSDTDVELCGVLVGNVHHDGAAPYLLIDGSIRGNAAISKGTQVTFTSETWTRIHESLERDFPGRRIVGWYHTHPGFGIFLSGMDLFIQDHFFNAPWQVAMVYDPIGGDEGVFVWRQGKSQREPHLLIADSSQAKAGWLHRGVGWIRERFVS